MMTRRRLLFGSAAATLSAASYPTLIEPRWLELITTRLRIKNRSPGSLRILQLTDIHSSWVVPMSLVQQAVEIGLAQNPDLICLTGDFITFGKDFDSKSYVTVLRELSAARPTFAVLGNHDGAGWTSRRPAKVVSRSVVGKLLEESGIELLHNRLRRVEVRDVAIQLAGVGDLWSNETDPDQAFEPAAEDLATIVLAHNPDSKDYLRSFRWELMLCGHTHGGQVIVPFEGPRYAPVEDKRYIAGLGDWDGRRLYVSRGVGNVGGVRFRCRPELTVLDVELG